ncbi:hypothetical protein CKK33_15545 [Mucilaginibacter sp. MD40]|uniref:hypothetical protein n=1 Tax=Mucilaginibacter sp. MD40 TaxID=2029590 RepID=UPI000BAC5345|nr:hypothetical protein [Mucilaginibacter sp. MD40]PAW94830.1 hypothetical protein CKK33_15545 [Mucilaginibacter sp. MD40]
MEIRDYITLIVLLVTVVSSHWLASRQTIKNKRSKWIEDFRSEIASFISLSSRIDPKNIDTLHELSKSGFFVLMLLDDRRKSHLELTNEIAKFNIFVTKFSSSKLDEFKQKISKIVELAKLIIKEEEKKL